MTGGTMRNLIPFLLILFLIAAFLHIDFFFTIVYLFFLVYLLSRLWTQYAVKGLRVQRRFVNRAFLGDQVTVDLKVHETGWLPLPWLELDETLPLQLAAPPIHQEVVSLGPREQRRLSYTLNCRKRGYYAVGPLKLRTGDLLGFARHGPMQLAPDHIIIYPQVVPLQRLGLPTRSPLAALPAKSPLFEDTARVMGVRDYQQGDSPRHIHWTATASAGRLLVKRYQPAIARETVICLDLDLASYEQARRYTATELAIVVAASIANHIIVNEKLPVGLVTEARDPLQANDPARPDATAATRFFLPPRSERAHLMSLLEVLARVEVAPASPFADVLRRESVRLPWGATLVAVTGQAGKMLFDTLMCLRRDGFAVALILVEPVGRVESPLPQQGVPIYRIWRESDLETLQ